MTDLIPAEVLGAVEAVCELRDLLADGASVPQQVSQRVTRMLAEGASVDIAVEGRTFVAKPSTELLALLAIMRATRRH